MTNIMEKILKKFGKQQAMIVHMQSQMQLHSSSEVYPTTKYNETPRADNRPRHVSDRNNNKINKEAFVEQAVKSMMDKILPSIMQEARDKYKRIRSEKEHQEMSMKKRKYGLFPHPN